MTFRQFISARFAERRARKADRAMRLVFGAAWDANRDGVYELLTAPTPLVVLDVQMLRGVVAEALATSAVTEEQAINPFPAEPVYEAEEPAAESVPVVPTAEVESPREDSIFEERNGEAAVPVRQNMMYDDDRRRAFLRTFFQQPVRGPVVPTR